jgi:ABC-2 type transport system ATP-binding protein
MRTMVREEPERGATVVFPSHVFDSVEAVRDRVSILGEGSLVAGGTVASFTEAR